LRDEVPKGIDEVISRCLNIDPKERFTDVAELAVALAPFGRESAVKDAEEIIRVLDAARRRANSPDAMPDTQRVESELSRVRRRVSRITGAARRRRNRIAFVVAAAVAIGLGAGAFRMRRPATVADAWTTVATRIGISSAPSAEPTPQTLTPSAVTTLAAPTPVASAEIAPAAKTPATTVLSPVGSTAANVAPPVQRATPSRAPDFPKPPSVSRAKDIAGGDLFGEPNPMSASTTTPSIEPSPAPTATTPAASGSLFEDRH
jgi:eukaryotic-like serine/threonine-protein kinase